MRIFAVVLSLVISGCAIVTSDPTLLRMTDVSSDLTRQIRAESVLLRTVSLPEYAAGEDIVRETSSGTLDAVPNMAWADLPERSVTLALSRHLGKITGALVGPEPWPMEGLADAMVDIRIEDMFASADQNYVIRGQYFISGVKRKVTPRARAFDVVVSLRGETLSAIPDAKAAAILILAEKLARDL